MIAPLWSAPPARAVLQLRRKLVAWLSEHGASFYEFLPVDASIDDPVLRDLARELGPVMPDNECAWRFGARTDDEEIPEDNTARWAQTLCAAWLLMRQPMVTVTRERHGKPRRTSWGEHLGSEVRLVHVRPSPQQGTTQTGAGERERSEHDHQWWVRGRWRRYHRGPGACPSRSLTIFNATPRQGTG